MKVEFKSTCVLALEYTKGEKKAKHISTDFNIEVSENLNREMYIGKDDLPTAAGTKALTQCFIQGLVGNIHQAHQNGYWDSAEHLRYIIAELERGFAAVANASKSEFKV